MYNSFFGFQERPFKLVPNPAYLYLSRGHQEAMAHLQYAVTDGEGFVEITGDVGTGKTLLCRTFLENLGPGIDSAYIFNPRMDALDLLKTINDEFGVPSHHDSKKALVDALNAFLMRKKAEGRRVILLIDEAQNLTKDVLEQIRLLSNLETTREKLLQIILVGQPELSEMLDSYELRQLGQRISLSCRIQALNFEETRQYIAHRIAVAAQKPAELFSRAAVRRIYRFSRGVPRLINIACDRALLTAYGQNRRHVSGRIARAALLELATRGDIRREMVSADRRKVWALAALCGVLAAVVLYQWGLSGMIQNLDAKNRAGAVHDKTRPSAPKLSVPSVPEKPSSSASSASPTPAEPAAPLPQQKPAARFQERMVAGTLLSRAEAFQQVLQCWEISPTLQPAFNDIPADMANDMTFFSLAARQNGLTATAVDRDLNRVVALNLPAVFKLIHPLDRRPVYGVAVKASSASIALVLDASGQPLEMSYPEFMASWDGSAVVFWKNFYDYKGMVAFNATPEAVAALKLHLRDIGYHQISINGDYDGKTQMIIKEIQARNGIPVDGFAGVLTQMVLYNETPSLKIPHLWPPGHFPEETVKTQPTVKPEDNNGVAGVSQ